MMEQGACDIQVCARCPCVGKVVLGERKQGGVVHVEVAAVGRDFLAVTFCHACACVGVSHKEWEPVIFGVLAFLDRFSD